MSESKLRRRARGQNGLAPFAATVLVLMLLVGCSGEDGARSEATAHSTGYPTNDSGLTYGSLAAAQTAEGEPQLIAVVATNGKEGYVLKAELDDTANEPASPEEAVARQVKIGKERRLALEGSLSVSFGVPVEIGGLAPDVVRATVSGARLTQLDGSMDAEAARAILGALTSQSSAAVAAAVAEEVNPVEVLLDALEADAAVSARKLEVYKSDGITVVGEFLAGR